MAGSLLIAGTASDVGKSIITTGLCRSFANRGVSVAPFKAQNMSNNSMVCAEGTEIGRAQWIQSLAARALPEAAMNPILLKPGSDRGSHVVVMGKPAGEISSREFSGGRTHLAERAYAAFDDLCARYDVVVCEGAGSPAEINLRRGDYVNMGLAQHAKLPTVIVGDIDHGGVFAAFFGTQALLDSSDQRLVAGFIANKFRGDPRLLRPGIDQLEQLTGRRVFGVVPWRADLWLDSEDSLDTYSRGTRERSTLRVAVIRLPRISNFTDVDALGIEPNVDVSFVSSASTASDADVIIVPGTRATVADLRWLRDRKLDQVIIAHAAQGKPVLGICGGFQMLGRRILDPYGVEGSPGADVRGLGLLDVTTEFGPSKVLRLASGTGLGKPTRGYEIHHGRITRGVGATEFLGGARERLIFGTMWHGSLESDQFRRAFLREVGGHGDSDVSFDGLRQKRLDILAQLCEDHLDVDALLDLTLTGPRQDAPVINSELVP